MKKKKNRGNSVCVPCCTTILKHVYCLGVLFYRASWEFGVAKDYGDFAKDCGDFLSANVIRHPAYILRCTHSVTSSNSAGYFSSISLVEKKKCDVKNPPHLNLGLHWISTRHSIGRVVINWICINLVNNYLNMDSMSAHVFYYANKTS